MLVRSYLKKLQKKYIISFILKRQQGSRLQINTISTNRFLIRYFSRIFFTISTLTNIFFKHVFRNFPDNSLK
jgi:transcriptional antiterminator